jgi:hypothetical protein
LSVGDAGFSQRYRPPCDLVAIEYPDAGSGGIPLHGVFGNEKCVSDHFADDFGIDVRSGQEKAIFIFHRATDFADLTGIHRNDPGGHFLHAA